MAVAFNRLGHSALRGSLRTCPRRSLASFRQPRRSFQTSLFHRDDVKCDPPTEKATTSTTKKQASKAKSSEKAATEAASAVSETSSSIDPAEQQKTSNTPSTASVNTAPQSDSFQATSFYATEEEEARFQALLDDPPPEHAEEVEKYKLELGRLEKRYANDIESKRPHEVKNPDANRFNRGFMSMGEDIEDGADVEDDVFEGDDITSLAHGELEQHRERREYARIAAWEMPLLSKFAKEFVPPTDAPLRFRYTSYMGETHPAENKVVMEFCTADLPLTNAQRLKLVKLVGARYDPQTDIVKMSCEMFDTIAQNKRYLGDLVDTLMATSKGQGNMEGAKDSFEDVPVDFRHVKWKTKPEFPEEWKLTEERKQQIVAKRAERQQLEQLRMEEGKLIDGTSIIDQAVRSPAAASASKTVGGTKASQRVTSLR